MFSLLYINHIQYISIIDLNILSLLIKMSRFNVSIKTKEYISISLLLLLLLGSFGLLIGGISISKNTLIVSGIILLSISSILLIIYGSSLITRTNPIISENPLNIA